MPTTRITIPHAVFGLDLGQSGDPSALATVLAIDSVTSPFPWFDPTHPHIKSWSLTATLLFPLGTAYMDVAREVHQTIRQFRQTHPTTQCTLVADATGLGRPTLEILYDEFTANRQSASIARLDGIVFTAGGTHSKSQHPSLPVDIYNIPKLDLIQNLLQVMETSHLTLAESLNDTAILEAQFKSLRYATSRQTGNTTIEVARSGNPHIGHADLVMALALATWRLRDLSPPALSPLPRRLPGF